MGYSCSYCRRKCVKGCGFKFFSFPKNDLLRHKWMKFCGFDAHPANDLSKLKLCSEHFTEASFRITRIDGPLLLKPDAVPSIISKKAAHNSQERTVVNEDRNSRLNRADKAFWEPSKTTIICSHHFVGGKKSEHPHSPSFMPTIFPSVHRKPKKSEKVAQASHESAMPPKRIRLSKRHRKRNAKSIAARASAQKRKKITHENTPTTSITSASFTETKHFSFPINEENLPNSSDSNRLQESPPKRRIISPVHSYRKSSSKCEEYPKEKTKIKTVIKRELKTMRLKNELMKRRLCLILKVVKDLNRKINFHLHC